MDPYQWLHTRFKFIRIIHNRLKNHCTRVTHTFLQVSIAQEVKVESAVDVTIQSGDHELSLADFLDGCANVVTETSTEVRSTLEDFDDKVMGDIDLDQDIRIDIDAPEAPEKHGKARVIFLCTR